jgi:hypothetical protein
MKTHQKMAGTPLPGGLGMKCPSSRAHVSARLGLCNNGQKLPNDAILNNQKSLKLA